MKNENILNMINYIDNFACGEEFNTILDFAFSCATSGNYCEDSCGTYPYEQYGACFECVKQKFKNIATEHQNRMYMLATQYEKENAQMRDLLAFAARIFDSKYVHEIAREDLPLWIEILEAKDRMRELEIKMPE